MQDAIDSYYKAIETWDQRREPFFALANYFDQKGELDRALIYYMAAMAIEFKPQGYLNDMSLYGSVIPDRIAFIYAKQGKEELAKEWWLKAMAIKPDKRIISNINWFYRKAPAITVCVPVLRAEGFERLKRSIKEKNTYNKVEIISEAGEGSALVKLNKLVDRARTELVMFMGDDTEIEEGCIEQALICFMEKFRGKGMVILNDGYWHGQIANHFLISRNVRDDLDGQICNTEYRHNYADVELKLRLEKLNLVEYCDKAKIIHHHYFCATPNATKNPKDKWNEDVEKHHREDGQILIRRLNELGMVEEANNYKKIIDSQNR